jgi:hypothetical protein
MKKNFKKYKHYTKIINKIESIRRKNNTNWMNILRVAFRYAPEQTSKIMSEIYIDDDKISKLVKKLRR